MHWTAQRDDQPTGTESPSGPFSRGEAKKYMQAEILICPASKSERPSGTATTLHLLPWALDYSTGLVRKETCTSRGEVIAVCPARSTAVIGPTSRGGAAPLKIRQLNSNKPLMISITAAVLPWMPKAAALLPPWCKTIAASPIGIIVATSINQPSGCAEP